MTGREPNRADSGSAGPCEGEDECANPSSPGAPDTSVDQDGDGFAVSSDCDDQDPEVALRTIRDCEAGCGRGVELCEQGTWRRCRCGGPEGVPVPVPDVFGARALGGVEDDSADAVALDPGGGEIFVVGGFSRELHFDGARLPEQGTGGDAFVAAFDDDLGPGWAIRIGGDGSDGAHAVVTRRDGPFVDAFVAGQLAANGGTVSGTAAPGESPYGGLGAVGMFSAYIQGDGTYASMEGATSGRGDLVGGLARDGSTLWLAGAGEVEEADGDVGVRGWVHPLAIEQTPTSIYARLPQDGEAIDFSLDASLESRFYDLSWVCGSPMVVGAVRGTSPMYASTQPFDDQDDAVFLVRTGGRWGGKRFIGPGPDEARAVSSDEACNVAMGGRFRGAIDLGEGSVRAHDWDGFVATFDARGALQWTLRLGGSGADRVDAVVHDGRGQVLVAGQVSDGADLGNGVPLRLEAPSGFVAGLDAVTGTALWALVVQASGPSQLRGLAVRGDRAYAVGVFEGATSLEPIGELTARRRDGILLGLEIPR